MHLMRAAAVAAGGLVIGARAAAAELSTGVDEQAGLPYWQITEPGMSLRLVQRLPDQTRAFFLARGLDREQVEQVAQSCVFQTVFENTSNESEPSPLRYDLDDWQVHTDERVGDLLTREHWKRIWEEQSVSPAAAIAFHWALFPTAQRYEPGDYNWGMSVFGLPPGTEFDLQVSWRQYGRRHQTVIEGIECAPDVHPEP